MLIYIRSLEIDRGRARYQEEIDYEEEFKRPSHQRCYGRSKELRTAPGASTVQTRLIHPARHHSVPAVHVCWLLTAA